MNHPLRQAGLIEQRFHTGEVELNYAYGPKHGPPLVLIPGQLMCWESYTRVLPALSQHFTVYAVDVRGHGQSGATPGHYNFHTIGRDMACFLEQVVAEAAIVSGNSSGGLIAIWLAAHAGELVQAIIPEDPPLFSSEWPRLRDECFFPKFAQLVVDSIDRPDGVDFGYFFSKFEVPYGEGKKIIHFPRWLSRLIGLWMRRYRQTQPRQAIDVPFLPLLPRLLIKSISMFDHHFTRAFLDGSACQNFSHAEALAQVRCPMLLLHADWYVHATAGLVGAMTDDDAQKTRSIVHDAKYVRVKGGHMIHLEKPQIFVREVLAFCQDLGLIPCD